MSDLFSRLQEELRFHKSHGIDLTHPRGVILNDKLYPAKQKGLTIPEQTGRAGRVSFLDIPYETENVAKVYHVVDSLGIQRLNVTLGNPSGYIYKGAVSIGNGYRTKIVHNYGNERYSNNENVHSHVVVPQKNNNPDWQHLHQTLKNWSNQPVESVVSKILPSSYGDNSRPMTDSEKAKHRAFSNEPIHNPDTLSVIHYQPKGGFKIYSYDVNTEALKPMEYNWKNKHIWGNEN